MSSSIALLFLIGGKGVRAKLPVKKQYVTVDNAPLFIHTLRAFHGFPFARTIVVGPANDTALIEETLTAYGEKATVIAGGKERVDSVRNGMRALEETPPDYVFIHDGVRPLIAHCDLTALKNAVEETGAAILAAPVIDTIKVVDEDGFITQTPARKHLYRAFTPQAFSYPAYREALAAYDSDPEHTPATDDASIYSAYKGKVRIAEGSPYNIKVTNKNDVILYQALKGTQWYE